MVRPLSFRRSSGGSSSSYAAFSACSLPAALPDDVLFEDVAHHLHQISKIKPLPIEGRTPCKKDALRSKTHAHLARLFALVPAHSTSRTELGKILFGVLFPHMDVHRRYDMKEGKLGRTLAKVLNVEVGHDEHGGWMEGEALMRWDDASFWGEEGKERGNWDGSMGQVVGRLQRERSEDLLRRSTLTISQVDSLLNELASHSSWSSHSIRHRYPPCSRRSIHSILAFLFSSLSPHASALVTQLLLRDITPFLHPPPTTLAMASLLRFDQASIYKLTHWDVMGLWDRTGTLRKAYRLRGNFGDALDACERGERVGVKVGVNVEIPKCQKGRALRSALLGFHNAGSKSVWAETKYDGERMQIHVDLSLPTGQQIKILSKSKRDSTADRASTHAAILAALFRPVEGCTVNSHLHRRLALFCSTPPERRVSRTVILEAEMVPYSERKSKIEEFWKITACAGDRRASFNRPGEDDTQELDRDDLHLMLVFFDVLELDGSSLIYAPYSARRETLELIIKTIPGFSMLAHRSLIRLDRGLSTAEADLQLAFAQSLLNHEEGLVLKSAESKYNFSPSWVKLKRDYIPGLDDTVDLVIVGASWDKERGRELNVSPSVFTTFFVGVRDERAGSGGSPHILVLFSISYGLSRAQLEDWNCRLQMGDSPTFVTHKSRAGMETLSYSFELVPSLKAKPPMVMLKRPLLGEVFGAGFQKLPSCKHFALRWPRLSKIYPASGSGCKSWTEGLTSTAYRKLALADLGRTDDPPAEREMESLDWDALFAPIVPIEPVRASQTLWQSKLLGESVRQSLEQEEERSTVRGDESVPSSPPTNERRKRARTDENGSPSKAAPVPARPKIKALGSVSNIIACRDKVASSLPTPPPTSPSVCESRKARKRSRPDDSGVCLSPSSSPSHFDLQEPVSMPRTLADLLASASGIFRPSSSLAHSHSRNRSPTHSSPWSIHLPKGMIVHQSLDELFSASGTRVAFVDPDRGEETQAILQRLEADRNGTGNTKGKGPVVVLNVWCLRARRDVQEQGWGRWIVR